MNPAPGSVFCEPRLAAKTQLREKPRQGFETWKTAWNPSPNVANSTVAMGMRAGLVLEGVRKTYRARYYNPTTGRFLSEDPIGFVGGMNLYAYAANNPIGNKDPLGLCVNKLIQCVNVALDTAKDAFEEALLTTIFFTFLEVLPYFIVGLAMGGILLAIFDILAIFLEIAAFEGAIALVFAMAVGGNSRVIPACF